MFEKIQSEFGTAMRGGNIKINEMVKVYRKTKKTIH